MLQRIGSIAVTTDFSDLSRTPFRAAATLSRMFGARLHLLHIVRAEEICMPWQLTPASAAGAERRQEVARKRLEEMAKREPAFDGLKVDVHAILGESVDAVHKFEERAEIDLIAIASHGHTGPRDFLLGSFTGKVLEIATCPVLVFRGQAHPGSTAHASFHPARILVPHDFSGPSRVALETASEWAAQFNARVRIVYVVDDRALLDGHALEPSSSIQERVADIKREGKQELERLIASNFQDVRADATVRVGQPAAEILKEASAFNADLIIMASRGLSVLERLSVGSVAERTIHGASCPVLAIKGKWKVRELTG